MVNPLQCNIKSHSEHKIMSILINTKTDGSFSYLLTFKVASLLGYDAMLTVYVLSFDMVSYPKKTWIFFNTAVRTSNLTADIYSWNYCSRMAWQYQSLNFQTMLLNPQYMLFHKHTNKLWHEQTHGKGHHCKGKRLA